MNKGKDDELAEAVLRAARQKDGRTKLMCADAFRLAAAFGVAPAEIGRICNGRNIKIAGCQLGCF